MFYSEKHMGLRDLKIISLFFLLFFFLTIYTVPQIIVGKNMLSRDIEIKPFYNAVIVMILLNHDNNSIIMF